MSDELDTVLDQLEEATTHELLKVLRMVEGSNAFDHLTIDQQEMVREAIAEAQGEES